MAYLDTPDGMRLHPLEKVVVEVLQKYNKFLGLGDIPLHEGIRLGGDIGMPTLSSDGLTIPLSILLRK